MCISRHRRSPDPGHSAFSSSLGLFLSLCVLLLMPIRDVAAQPVMIMAMGHAGGQPDDVVTVDLTLFTTMELSGDPLRVAGLDLTLQWDSSLAALEGVSRTEATGNWILAANPSPGAIAVSMATIEPASATPAGLPVLAFTFRLLDMVGQTPLHLVGTRAFDIDQVFIEHLPADGQLDVGVVGTASWSMGRIKSAFVAR